MPKFDVFVQVSFSGRLIVDAANEQEARAIAAKLEAHLDFWGLGDRVDVSDFDTTGGEIEVEGACPTDDDEEIADEESDPQSVGADPPLVGGGLFNSKTNP